MKSEAHSSLPEGGPIIDSTSSTPWPRWPFHTQEMIHEVTRVLEEGSGNYWAGGPCRAFEEEFAGHVGAKHGVAVANGTLALELALHALEIGPGDEVIVPSRTFIATASSVVARGARPVCAEVDRDSQNLTADTVEPLITPRTKAVIAVHLAGHPCDMDPLLETARSHSLALVEDCAQAHGAKYKSRTVGAIGDIGAYSFCQDKIISTGGEGGMLVTNRTDLWDRAWRQKDHGKTPDAYYKPSPTKNRFRWVHESFGSNYRMSGVLAAIGRVALRSLDGWTVTRTQHAQRLSQACAACPALRTPTPSGDLQHAWYKFYTFVRPEMLKPGWDRDRVIDHITQLGVPCYAGSCGEIYLERAFPKAWRPAVRHPFAKELHKTSLMFRVDPALTTSHIEATARAIQSVMRSATLSGVSLPREAA